MIESVNTAYDPEKQECNDTKPGSKALKKTSDGNEKGSEAKTQKIAEVIVASFLLILSGWWGFIAYTTVYPPSPRRAGTISTMAIPKIALTILFIISLFQLISSVRWLFKHSQETKGQKVLLFEGKIFPLCLSLVLFAVFWRIIGFSLTAFLEFVFLSKLLEPERNTRMVILVGLAFTVGVVILFGVVFKIPFYDPLMTGLTEFIRIRSSSL